MASFFNEDIVPLLRLLPIIPPLMTSAALSVSPSRYATLMEATRGQGLVLVYPVPRTMLGTN